MREILFKAKRKDNGEWVYWNIIGELRRESGKRTRLAIKNGATTSYYHYIHQIWQFILIDTICQYTGLTDKNGNKIWENDVVWIGGTDRAIVIFSEKHSGYILQPIGDFYFDSPMLVDNVDIIDNCIENIFDNPELWGV